MTISRFEDIDAWQDARVMTKHVYECTSRPSFARDFGLRDQIQRAAGSGLGPESLVLGSRITDE